MSRLAVDASSDFLRQLYSKPGQAGPMLRFPTSSDDLLCAFCAQRHVITYIYGVNKAKVESIEISGWVNDKLDTETVDAAPVLAAQADVRYGTLKKTPGATEVWKKERVGNKLQVVWHEKRDNERAPWLLQPDDKRISPGS